MEGNLSRARTTLYSPTLSVESSSTPSPPMVRPSTAIHRDHDTIYNKNSHGHTRISSENNIPTLPIDVVKPGIYVPRSSSALGAAGGYRPPLHSPRSADYMHENARSKTSLHVKEPALEPLSEDDVSQSVGSSRPSLEGARLDTFLSPSFGSYTDKGLKRSASTAQMRDLKDQMKDLKGRLSTLRDQARADSLKRRSLQSLRTPSPFTHARVEQWYADTAKYGDTGSVHSDYKSQVSNEDVSSNKGGERNLAAEQMGSQVEEESMPNGFSSADGSDHPRDLGDSQKSPRSHEDDNLSVVDQEEDDLDDMQTEDGYEDDGNGSEQEEEEVEAETAENEQDVVDDSASESGASSYYDTVQNQVSHEDREDAFDYEHFFLHSAMGTMSQSRMRRKGSRDSFSSEDSVETTRGPVASTNSKPTTNKAGNRSRRNSVGSVSSVDSFATATEGRHTRADNEYYREHGVIIPKRARTHTPDTARRPGFPNETSDSGSDRIRSRAHDIRRPQSSAAAFMHRPSMSSLDSGRTHRSFPLVNKAKVNGGMLTPRESPDRELKQISEALLNESFSSAESGDSKATPIEMLQKDDRILVERLVASLGRCVLGLTESGRGTAEYRAYRRRIEAARRILESSDEPA
ncbi:hypothetical protein F5Y05DRAFT_386631 [Hypoxylon sp. FL0543]|nr:hypothetical protein F5Y05DRAFT_386631 [Hypoxylon sp. FL0543]